jgi:hypothetical protein
MRQGARLHRQVPDPLITGDLVTAREHRCRLLTNGQHIVTFDDVVRTMWETGLDLKSRYRETGEGRLTKIHLHGLKGDGRFSGMGR